MCDTVHALLMRELKTRFGANRLGYFWALAEPVAQAGILAIIFTLIGRDSLSGIPIAMFLFVGILPYQFFSKLITQLSVAADANRALFAYRQVTPIDPVITRLIIEVTTFFIVYIVIFSVMAWLGIDALPNDVMAVVMAMFLLIALSCGIGLMLCSAMIFWSDIPKLVAMAMRPMFFISGIFYSATMISEKYWYLFSWNPIFHVIELSRDAFFISYRTPIGDWYYLIFVTLCSLCLGLMTFYINRHRFSDT